jgi:hypothetical protein
MVLFIAEEFANSNIQNSRSRDYVCQSLLTLRPQLGTVTVKINRQGLAFSISVQSTLSLEGRAVLKRQHEGTSADRRKAIVSEEYVASIFRTQN